jgi:hypothetical protein
LKNKNTRDNEMKNRIYTVIKNIFLYFNFLEKEYKIFVEQNNMNEKNNKNINPKKL